jgi:hypothetical protein
MGGREFSKKMKMFYILTECHGTFVKIHFRTVQYIISELYFKKRGRRREKIEVDM